MAQKTIIVIDDDSDDIDVMQEILNQIDPTSISICFHDPCEAIRFLTKKLILLPSFIFIDINMPKITGIECLSELRKIKEFDPIPIVIYSTAMTDTTSEELLKKGASYTLQKPNNIADYLPALEAIILGTEITNRYVKGVTPNFL